MRFLTISLICFTLFSCGVEQKSTSNLHNESDPNSVDNEVADILVGHYAMLVKYTSSQKLPLVGTVNSVDRLYKVAEIERDGNGLKITERSCRLEFYGNAVLGLSFEDKSIQSSPAMIGRFFAKRADAESPILFARETLTQVFGAHLTDPENERLPESKDDPRLFDVDNDGGIAATSSVRALFLTGKASYVKRSSNHYEGFMDSEGDLRGLITDKTEGLMLDISNPLLKLALGRFEFVPDADKSKSNVRLKKLPGKRDCSDISWKTYFRE